MVSRAIGCGSQGECIARHNHLRDAIFATASSAHLAPTKEDRALLPNSEGRHADVMLKNFQGGLHAALDVSVINPLQTLTVQRAAEEPGYALTLRRNQKWGKYGDRCLAEGIKFCPVIVETTGSWHPEAENLLCRISVCLAHATGGEDGEVKRHIFGHLSVMLQRDNVTLILNRTPTAAAPEVDGFLSSRELLLLSNM